MILSNDGIPIIGVDVGYQFVKTANSIFPNGVTCLGSTEPSLKDNSLFYEGMFYKVGEGRESITDSKIADGNARILTMVAIARELRSNGITSAEVVLVVGLPFSNYGREKQDVINYYNKYPELNFEYEGVRYHVVIRRTICCPQCYSAIAPRLSNMIDGDYMIIDVGSKTSDIIFVQKGHPIESKSITVEHAMIKWIRYIQGQLQIQYSRDIPEEEILKVLLNEKSLIPTEYSILIKETMKELIEEFELELKERGYNLDYVNVIYVGGGALVAKNYTKSVKNNHMYDCDLKANAKGYEFLASTMIGRAGDVV